MMSLASVNQFTLTAHPPITHKDLHRSLNVHSESATQELKSSSGQISRSIRDSAPFLPGTLAIYGETSNCPGGRTVICQTKGSRMHRRSFLTHSAAVAAGLAISGPFSVAPATAARSEFPELTITLTDEGFVFPASTTAGRYAVSIVNESSSPSHSSLGLLPESVDRATVDAVMASDTEDVPQWFLDAHWVGLPDWGYPGETRSGIVDLSPGTYLGFSPFLGWWNIIEIPGDPITAPEPAPTASVDLAEMAFTWGQDPFPPGPQLLEVTNLGATLHDIQFLAVPAGTTTDHAMEVFMLADSGGTPSPDNPLASLTEDFAPVAASSIVSPGVTTWLNVDLAPGNYLVMCPLPFPSGPPHAVIGMMEIIEVRS